LGLVTDHIFSFHVWPFVLMWQVVQGRVQPAASKLRGAI